MIGLNRFPLSATVKVDRNSQLENNHFNQWMATRLFVIPLQNVKENVSRIQVSLMYKATERRKSNHKAILNM